MNRDEATTERLYWHCTTCGNHEDEPAQAEYERGDWEPCAICGDGIARVMTLKEAASFEQQVALGNIHDGRKRKATP